MENMRNLFETLICPDCRKKLEHNKHKFKCKNCGRIFSDNNGILNLLPSSLEDNKLNEEKNYKGSRINRNEILKISKNNDFKFFKTEFLPKHMQIGNNMLEIGAGSCWMSSMLKLKAPWAEVVASDVSLTALRIGRRVASTFKSHIDHFLACDVERLPFENETFDVVMGSSMIHHLFDPEKGVSEIHRVLKKGGRIYILDFGLAKLLKNKIVMSLFKHRYTYWGVSEKSSKIIENVFTFEEWKNLFSSAGFRDVHVNLERNYNLPPQSSDIFYFKSQNITNILIHKIMLYFFRMVSLLPGFFKKNFMVSGIGIIAKK
jgi:ubiquinone/menaquinone biosynthesis C-methylase UbiE